MSETKHTPGPWRVSRKDDTRVVGVDGFAVADTGGAHLHERHNGDKGHWATTPGSHREMTQEEEEANACIVSAAPEMLAALRILHPAPGVWRTPTDAQAAEIEAALLKAAP